MAQALESVTNWAFMSECPIPLDVRTVLAHGEQPVAAYKTVRDSAVLTSHRVIFRDSQGVTGRKTQIFSLPYSSILMWSSENAGTLDFTSTISLWTVFGEVTINIGRGVDVRTLDTWLAHGVLSQN